MTTILECILIFLLGSSLASFALCFEDSRTKNSFKLRSACESCGKKLKSHELIPIFSYIFLRGRCLGCSAKIRIELFIFELLGGALFSYMYLKLGFDVIFFIRAIEIIVLLLIAYSDLRSQFIYTSDVSVIFISELILKLYFRENLFYSLKYSLIIALLFLVFTKFSLMGMGDVELAFASCYGFNSFRELFIYFETAFVTAGIIAIFLILSGRKHRRDAIAFGPFLVIAAIFLIILNLGG